MKKNKIICLIICILMIVTVFPVVGLPVQTGLDNNSNFTQPHYQAPTPEYTPIPPVSTIIHLPMVHEHPEKTAATMDDIVISILEQVDETMYLRYLENLTAFGPHITTSDACNASAEYIYNQFKSMGLAVRYHSWDSSGLSSVNVEATINGTDKSSDEIYIICAHYDTVSAGPGADDDTSGTVAVIMAAFIMSQYQYKFNHTIKFVAFSGEEQGLLGSRAYASNAAEEGWNIVGVLNADMISYAETTNDGNNLIVFQNDASEWLYNYTNDISIEYADYIHLKLYAGGPTWGSDHYYFWDEGYDALFYFEYKETPYYHTSGDTIDHINTTYAMKNIRLIFATLAELSEVSIRNNPPTKPVLTGPDSGVIKQAYNLSIVSTEPEGEDVYYLIDWGDGQIDEWAGPYNSGVTVEITHQWNKKGTYTIKAKAKDIYGTESSWGTLSVVMPTEYTFSVHTLLQHLLGIFSQRFPILLYIVKH
jgi:Peptidase family M28/PKD domain